MPGLKTQKVGNHCSRVQTQTRREVGDLDPVPGTKTIRWTDGWMDWWFTKFSQIPFKRTKPHLNIGLLSIVHSQQSCQEKMKISGSQSKSLCQIIFYDIFGMAAMPFLCNGTLLFQGNIPRVLAVSDNLQICQLSYPLYRFIFISV